MEEPLDDGDDGDDGDVRHVIVDIWPCHELAVAVFQACDIHGVGAGMGGIWWAGITASELRSALGILRVPLAQRADVAADVQTMGAAVAAERNRRADAARKSK